MTQVQPQPLQIERHINQGAGFWIRALARAIDVVYGYLLGLIGAIITGIVLGIMQFLQVIGPEWAENISRITPVGFVLSLVGAFLYHTICEGIHGASLGKLICSLRVLNDTERPCSFRGAIIRNLSYFVDALFFGLIGYLSMQRSPLNQRYGDVWGRTIVVRVSYVPLESKKSGLVFFGALVLGSGIWVSLLILSWLLQVFGAV